MSVIWRKSSEINDFGAFQHTIGAKHRSCFLPRTKYLLVVLAIGVFLCFTHRSFAQERTILVCYLSPWPKAKDGHEQAVSISIHDKMGKIVGSDTTLRHTINGEGIFASSVPRGSLVTILFGIGPLPRRCKPVECHADEPIWTGPWRIQLHADNQAGDILLSESDLPLSKATRFTHVCSIDYYLQPLSNHGRAVDDLAQVKEELTDTVEMSRGAGIVERDCVLWAFEYLRREHAKSNDEVKQEIERSWSQIENQSEIFRGDVVQRKRHLYEKLLVSEAGEVVEIAREDLQAEINQPQHFAPVVEAALLTYATIQKHLASPVKRWALDDATWKTVQSFAKDTNSGLSYAALSASVFSPQPAQKNLLWAVFSEGSGYTYAAALDIVSETKDVDIQKEANSRILDRINSDEGRRFDPTMKQALSRYVARNTVMADTQKFVDILSDYTEDSIPTVSGQAATTLMFLRASRGVKLPTGVNSRINNIDKVYHLPTDPSHWLIDKQGGGRLR